jgi:cold shock protein
VLPLPVPEKHPGGSIYLATGTVKWFSAEKGCGFIVPDGGGTPLFVDDRAIVGGDHETLAENTRVQYESAEGEYGLEARNVTFPSV